MRVEFFDCPLDILTTGETVSLARQAMLDRQCKVHVSMNVAKLVNMRSNPVLTDDVRSSDIIGVDGMGIALAAKALGYKTVERVAGIDLFQDLLQVCSTEGFRPFLLGATPEVLANAVAAIKAKYPTIKLAGFRDGFYAAEQEADVVADIRSSGADCLFIGMPTPRKERFLAQHKSHLGVPFIMGVGGSFDVLSGHVKRAPVSMQRLGLEWLYRTYQEPRRMWLRYCKTNTIFAGMMLLALTRKIFSSRAQDQAKTPTDAGSDGASYPGRKSP